MDVLVLMQTAVPRGGYIDPYKVLTVLVITIAWWRLLTWLDKDAEAARLPREWVNLGLIGGYVLGFALLLLLPGFWLGLAAYLVIFLAGLGVYLAIRHQKAGLNDLIADLKSMQIFKGGAKAQPKEEVVVGEVGLSSKDGRHMNPPSTESPERPSYDVIQTMITDPLRRGMERLDLMPIEGGVVVQYWVDGVMYTGAQFSRAGVAGAITLLKQLAGLDLNEKRKPQAAMIQATLEGKKKDVQLQTAGSTAGESLRLLVDPKKRHELRLDGTGMAADQLELVRRVVNEPGGVVLLSVPKGQGLTTLEYAVLRQHDAFLSHLLTVERDPEDDLEGVTQNALARGASPQEELDKVQWVISQQPDAILVADVQNPKSVRDLVEHAIGEEGKRVYIGIHAPSAIDAIAEWRSMVGDDELAMKSLRMVIAGRVVRVLCSACKQPYQADPETLRKLNLDHGKAQQFFQARTQPMQDSKGNPIHCTFCAEMKYKGRTGVYEVMEINEEVRQNVLQNASVNQLRALFRKMKGRFVQEQALALVEQGLTSIQEVSRAMRGQDQAPAGQAHPGGTGTFGSGGTTAQGTRMAQQPPKRPPNAGAGGR